MTHFCDYHPSEPGKWYCADCQRSYCGGCMPDADRQNRRGFCPHCNQNLKYLGAAGQVVPFWTRIGAFFRYPLGLDPLLLIALCTLVPAILSANLLGLLVTLFLLFVLVKYNYSVVRHTAEGNMKPPSLASAFSGTGFGVIFKQFAVFFLMGALISAADLVGGDVLAFLVTAFLVLALPASVIILAMEDRILPAVNPLQLAALMARVGWPYFILYTHLILFLLAGAVVQDFALGHFAPWLGQPIAGFVNSYFTLIFFHMLGYLLFQYQGQLGFASDLQEDDETDAGTQRDPARRTDADQDMALKDGDYDRLQALLLEALRQQPDNPRHIERLYRLIRARDDGAGFHQHHRKFIPWLASGQDAGALADSLRDLFARDENFQLEDPALSYQCAQVLYRGGEYRLVLRLLKDFHKRFPHYDNLAGAYLLAAKTLANGLQRFDKATLFLRFIQQKCPGHPLQGVMDHYLEQARGQQLLEAPKTDSP